MLASYKNQTTSGSFNEYASEKEPTYFLEKVRPIFTSDDFTIVNLENVFTDKNLKEVSKNHSPAFWYRSQTSNVNILTSSSVEGVSIANNHIYDYGQQGYKDTVETLRNANLDYGFDEKIMYFEKEGFVIAVICHGLWGEWQADDIVHLINTAELKSDYQIVFYHGGKEKVHEPDKWKVKASRKLVDAGADLVIGNHPHVLQPREIYNDVEIIYSLGNFCYGGNKAPENRTIIYQMKLTVGEENEIVSQQSNIIPCYVYTAERNNYQPTPIENQEEIEKVLSFINGEVSSPI
jgi:poly-gamma-glutamate synthesis protein (capsule biosynthesis protein)